MELPHRSCETSQPEIGRLVGALEYPAVNQARKWIR
jgi:hypothetical protein